MLGGGDGAGKVAFNLSDKHRDSLIGSGKQESSASHVVNMDVLISISYKGNNLSTPRRLKITFFFLKCEHK